MTVKDKIKQKIRISAGTASVLGLNNMVQKHPSRTAYFMVGERCENSCLFCTQSTSSCADTSFLSRISWPEMDTLKVFERLKEKADLTETERVCFQVVAGKDSNRDLTWLIKEIKSKDINVKISVSVNTRDAEFIDELMLLGADNISIPLDAATPELFKKHKGCQWDNIWDVLDYTAVNYPGKTATHLILGLGETEKEIIELLYILHLKGINTGLFAFTPIKGTPLSDKIPPELSYYRRIQLIYYLIKKNILTEFEFKDDKFKLPDTVKKLLKDDMNNKEFKYKEVFNTCGCTLCTRPYYNETPGSIPYNYPGDLTDEEYTEAVTAAIS
ncbi:MAG: radical SAM protein [Armatimonadota bacterium]